MEPSAFMARPTRGETPPTQSYISGIVKLIRLKSKKKRTCDHSLYHLHRLECMSGICAWPNFNSDAWNRHNGWMFSITFNTDWGMLLRAPVISKGAALYTVANLNMSGLDSMTYHQTRHPQLKTCTVTYSQCTICRRSLQLFLISFLHV